MAVTITDTRIVFVGATTGTGQADNATDWTGGTVTPAQNTTTYAEATASLTSAINISTDSFALVLTAALDLSDSMIYIQSYNAALQGGWDTGGTNNTHHGIYLTDGTNQAIFHMSGNDKDVFKHADSQVQFQCLLLDGAEASNWNTASHVTMLAGTFASLDMTAITIVGAYYETLSKGLGGGWTCAIDVMRYGNGGLTITGGATGAGNGSTFLEIVTEDRSTADGKALGVIREYSTGIYGIQGSFTFGNTITGDNWFEDTGVVLVFEDRPVADDKYSITVVGNAGGTNSFILTNSTVTTAGPLVTCNFSDADINTLTLTGCNFSGLGNSISFGNDTAAASHTVTNNTFSSCGQIDPGDTIFTDNVISATTSAVNSGALLIDADGTSAISDLSFIFDTAGHASYIPSGATGTYTLTNFTYSGYSTTSPGSNLVSSTGSTDACIYNNSGGAVTLNITGGTTPTIRNGASATTTVVSNVTVTITVQDSGANVIAGAQVAIFQSSDDSVLLASDATDDSGQVSASVSASLGAIYVRVRQSTNIRTFLTSSSTTDGVDDASDTINNTTLHNFHNGDAVVYSQNGGSQNIGLTDGTTYYVNASDSPSDTTSVRLYTTATLAIAAGTPIALTAGGSETHQLDPVRYFPNSTVGTVGADNVGITVTMVTDTTVIG